MTTSAIAGVRYLRGTRHDDSRGSFRELWRASTLGPGVPHFVQANLSVSERGVLRGLHYHQRQLDYWTVSVGRAFVALVDVRSLLSGASVAPVIETRVLAAEDVVVVPAGVGHGFLALEKLELIYLVTNEYDGTDELGFAWDDPALGIAWPLVGSNGDGRPILSARDQANPTLSELLGNLRRSLDG